MTARFTGRQWRKLRAEERKPLAGFAAVLKHWFPDDGFRESMKLCACGRWYIEKCWGVCFECMKVQAGERKPEN